MQIINSMIDEIEYVILDIPVRIWRYRWFRLDRQTILKVFKNS